MTGGFAVELYTGSAYRTLDVDLIAEGEAARVVEELLKRIAERGLRVYIPRLEALASKAIDIVSSTYAARRKPVEVRIGSYVAYVEPVEELIVKYLAAWKHWDSTVDRDKALMLINAWIDRVDKGYLRARAKEEMVEDKLEEALKVLGHASR